MLADGIYPELSRVAKTINEPRGHGKKQYALWQESARKDIERAFGVIQNKFRVLKNSVEMWYLDDINKIVETTIILHNMMVEYRINKNEKEDSHFYEIDDDESVNNVPIDFDEEANTIQQQNARLQINRKLEETYCNGDDAMPIIQVENFVREHDQICNERWHELYNEYAHYYLQDAIVQQLIKNENEKESNK
jgi:hypothetical protein